MANVPEYQPSVGIEAPGIPSSRMEPITPAASGVNVAEAAAGLGKTAENLGSDLGRHIIYNQRLEAQMDSYDRLSNLQQNIQNRTAGLFERKGSSAKGIMGGTLPPNFRGEPGANDIKYEDSVVGITQDELKKAMDGLAPYEASHVERRAKSIIGAFHGRAANHEAKEKNVADIDSANNLIENYKQAASVARSPEDLEKIAMQAEEPMKALYHLHGQDISDPKVVDQAERSANSMILRSGIEAHVEADPDLAKKLFTTFKDSLSNVPNSSGRSDRTETESVVNGKWLQLRSLALANDLIPKHMARDGVTDLAGVLKEVKSQTASLPPLEQQAIEDHVKSRIPVFEKEYKDSREIADAKFHNSAIDLWNKKVPFDQAQDQLMKGPKAYKPIDNIDMKTKEDWMISLWSGQKERALEKLSVDQKEAIAEGKNAATGYYKKDVIQLPGESFKRSSVDLFNKTLEDKAIKNRWTPEQIRKYTKDTLQQVPAGDQRIFKSIIPGGLPWSHKEQALKVEMGSPLQDMAIRAKVASKIQNDLGRAATQAEVDRVISTVYGHH